MLTKGFRFRGRQSVVHVLKHGQHKKTPRFSARISDGARGQLAVVVSKKVSARAVTRNRIRRRIFAAARPIIEEPGFNKKVVIIVRKPDVEQENFENLQKEINALLSS